MACWNHDSNQPHHLSLYHWVSHLFSAGKVGVPSLKTLSFLGFLLSNWTTYRSSTCSREIPFYQAIVQPSVPHQSLKNTILSLSKIIHSRWKNAKNTKSEMSLSDSSVNYSNQLPIDMGRFLTVRFLEPIRSVCVTTQVQTDVYSIFYAIQVCEFSEHDTISVCL